MTGSRPDSSARFHVLADGWLTGLSTANTRDAYGRDLTVFAEWCGQSGRSPLAVRRADVDRYRDACANAGAGQATVARRLSALSSFYEYALAVRAVRVNPVARVDRPTTSAASVTPRTLTSEEAVALFDSALFLGTKVAVLIALLLWDGMKLGEALTLDIDHLDPRPAGMTATVAGRGDPRMVALDARTASAVSRYLDGRDSGPLLVGDSPTRPGGRLTRFGADFLVKQAAEHAGLGRAVSANTLRRSYIIAADQDGTAVHDIQRHVGHGTLRDTRRYLE